MPISVTCTVASNSAKTQTASAIELMFQWYGSSAISLLSKLANKLKAIVLPCAARCSDQWDPELDSEPCIDGPTDRLTLTSNELLDTTIKRGSRSGTITVAMDLELEQLRKGMRRRTTQSRDIRQKRRALVLSVTTHRAAFQVDPGVDYRQKSGSIKVETSTAARLSSTPVPKQVSPQLRASTPTDKPKWQPASCTVPGVTCGEGASNAHNPKYDMRDESMHKAQLPSMSVAKRETEPEPRPEAQPLPKKIRKWKPTLCTSEGITCAVSGGTEHEFASSDTSKESESPTITAPQPTTSQDERRRDVNGTPRGVPYQSMEETFAEDDGSAV